MSQQTVYPELITKKQVLDYIQQVKQMQKEGLEDSQLEQAYTHISQSIDAMKEKVKPNTIAYLKTQLDHGLGKYKPLEMILAINYFIEFFKEAYPDGKRRKEYTWVLADPSRITVEQILHTLKYINGYCLKERLKKEAKEDILPMIERIAKTNSLKHINQVRSMEGIRKALRIKIISTPEGHQVIRI